MEEPIERDDDARDRAESNREDLKRDDDSLKMTPEHKEEANKTEQVLVRIWKDTDDLDKFIKENLAHGVEYYTIAGHKLALTYSGACKVYINFPEMHKNKVFMNLFKRMRRRHELMLDLIDKGYNAMDALKEARRIENEDTDI